MDFFDLHADTPLLLDEGREENSAVDVICHTFEKYIQTMAIYIRDNEIDGFDIYNRRICATKKFALSNGISIVGNDAIPSCGIMLSVENAGFLADNTDDIYKLKNDGVKMLSLTWNGDNLLASGANGDSGLTAKGRDVIKLINQLGLVLDISHLSHKAALEAINLADRVVASHSCLYDIHPHRRNLKRDAIKALKEKNGIIGLCFYPEFLGSDNVFAQLEKSICYLCDLEMEDNIAFGSDFDGAKMTLKLNNTKQIPTLYDHFVKNGLKKSLLEKIFYKNAIAFFDKVCENK